MGASQKYIAKAIEVSPSTISRELRRNSGARGRYNPAAAQASAAYNKRKRPGNRAISDDVMQEARQLLVSRQWSPEQMSGALALEGKFVSHETIYRMIRKDKAGGGDLYKHCRHKLKHRARPVGGKGPSIPNRTPISERPKEADGTRFGDFEMDTIVGQQNHGAIVTITERSTNMLFMRKLAKGKNAKELARTVIHLLATFKGHIKTITTDNGLEFACHETIAKALDTKVYFADPYSSWQKGAIENTNGLIRQYIPKSRTFDGITHQQITKISTKINNRPRKKLDFKTPRERFYEKIH